MSSYCLSNLCPGGNCPGCRNGTQYCQDPRCYPNCPNCESPKTSSGWGWWVYLLIILVILILIVFLFFALRSRKPICDPHPVVTRPIVTHTEVSHMEVSQPVTHTEIPIKSIPRRPIEFVDDRQNNFVPRYPSKREIDDSLNVPSPIPFMAKVPDFPVSSEVSDMSEIPEIPVLPDLNPIPEIPVVVPEIPMGLPITLPSAMIEPSIDSTTTFERGLEKLRQEAVLEPTVSISPTPIVQRASKIISNVPRASLPPAEKLTAVPTKSVTPITTKSLNNMSDKKFFSKNNKIDDDIIHGF